eukprot:1319489-Amphidinium_carterae.1
MVRGFLDSVLDSPLGLLVQVAAAVCVREMQSLLAQPRAFPRAHGQRVSRQSALESVTLDGDNLQFVGDLYSGATRLMIG